MRKNTNIPNSNQIFSQILDQASIKSKQSLVSVTDLLHSYDQILSTKRYCCIIISEIESKS